MSHGQQERLDGSRKSDKSAVEQSTTVRASTNRAVLLGNPVLVIVQLRTAHSLPRWLPAWQPRFKAACRYRGRNALVIATWKRFEFHGKPPGASSKGKPVNAGAGGSPCSYHRDADHPGKHGRLTTSSPLPAAAPGLPQNSALVSHSTLDTLPVILDSLFSTPNLLPPC